MTLQIINGDSLEVLATLPDCSIDAVVTDPPYGLSNTDPAHVAETIGRWLAGERDYLPSGKGFMGKEWDGFVPPPALWDECLRVLKPGGHVLAFAGSRTMDLMSLGLRLAGFDIRDSVAWLYGSGFPKSMDISKAIDKAAGAEREVVGERKKLQSYGSTSGGDVNDVYGGGPDKGGVQQITAPATPEAEQWEGWGTALKPAFEPVIMARKPFKGTVAANVLEHGTGALNIDGCRIATDDKLGGGANKSMTSDTRAEGWARPWMEDDVSRDAAAERSRENTSRAEALGRFPANVILDEDQAAVLDGQSGTSKSASTPRRRDGKGTELGQGGGWNAHENKATESIEYGDSGGASRFFYVAKAPKKERPVVDGVAHPTVKPLSLMRYLIRMVTPPGGVVLEPFAGSGTTVEAALEEGMGIIAVERDETYLPLIQARIDRYMTSQMEDLI